MKKMPLIFTFILAGYLLLSTAPAARAFMALYHENKERHLDNLLIHKVHAPFWTIHYSFENCGEVDEETQKKYTQIVTKYIQSWLQPLREYTDRPIVNDFRYRLSDNELEADFHITTFCRNRGRSMASFGGAGIEHRIDFELELTWTWTHSILHELGHLFGLADTYLEFRDEGKPGLDTGGRDSTKGSQPSSIMTGANIISAFKDINFNWDEQVPLHGVVSLGEDDRNGIIWLYKFIYEGLALEDCFFPNYELEDVPHWGLGCVPKYPLLFALRYHLEFDSHKIIEEDEGLDVNVQDADGLTALHHAILNGYTRVIETLFLHRSKDLDVNVKDAEGRTALHHAVIHSLENVVKNLLAHPACIVVKTLMLMSKMPRGALPCITRLYIALRTSLRTYSPILTSSRFYGISRGGARSRLPVKTS